MEDIEFIGTLRGELQQAMEREGGVTRRRSRRYRRPVAIASLAFVAVAGLGSAVTIYASTVPTPQEKLVATILDGMKGTQLSNVSVGDVPSGMAAPTDSKWLDVTVPANVAPPDDVKATWETMLMAAAYEDQAASYGAPDIAGWTINDPAGSSKGTFFLQGNRTPVTQTTADAAAAIQANLQNLGLTELSISFEQPDGLAPIVIAQVEDPAAWLAKGYSESDIFGPDHYVGTFFELLDSNSDVVLAAGHSDFITGGTVYTAPKYRSQSTIGTVQQSG
jgi:hypothetical protein